LTEVEMLSRRGFVAAAAGLLVMSVRGRWLTAQPATPITIYKSKSCGCCAKWVDHVSSSGFETTVHDHEEMEQLKNEVGVPAGVRSCHTAIVGAYLIEGHVPASDIRRLLTERPKVAGLTVPGMPGGTPGMAEPGTKIGDFEVLAFQSDGSTRRFASH
jgi:hypothetical protein